MVWRIDPLRHRIRWRAAPLHAASVRDYMLAGHCSTPYSVAYGAGEVLVVTSMHATPRPDGPLRDRMHVQYCHANATVHCKSRRSSASPCAAQAHGCRECMHGAGVLGSVTVPYPTPPLAQTHSGPSNDRRPLQIAGRRCGTRHRVRRRQARTRATAQGPGSA